MIGIDLRHKYISGVYKYVKRLTEFGIYDSAFGDPTYIRKTYPIKKILPNYNRDWEYFKNRNDFHDGEKKLVMHFPFTDYPLGYQGKSVVTVHDIIPLVVKGHTTLKKRMLFKLKMTYALHHANKIITVSERTKQDIMKVFKISKNKIDVVYNGVDPIFYKQNEGEYNYLYDKYSLPKHRKYILTVGNKQMHKNLKRVIDAFQQLPGREQYGLILVGGKTGEYDNIEQYIEEKNLRNDVFEVGFVTDEDLVSFYNLAQVFVFASLYEGFGIPPLEAMACGTAVVCSMTTSMPEVVGDAAYPINPYKVSSIVQGIDHVLKDTDLRDKLIEKGYQRAEKFSWEKSAIETKKVLSCLE